MQNISPQIFKQVQEAICRPEGTFTFKYRSKDLFDKSKRGGVILEIPSGQHLFRLERDDALFLHFYHSAPGTGTRVASIDLNAIPASPDVFMAFSWTPKQIRLHIGPSVPGSKLVSAAGAASPKQFRIGTNGNVFQIVEQGAEIMGISLYQGGLPIVQPSALEAWKETILAVDILATGNSNEGHIYEVIVSNLTLAVLVTGFEAYTKRRFLELEQEGLHPDTKGVIESFYTKKEREAGIATLLQEEAADAKKSLLQQIVYRGAINFQSFRKCKRAYNKAYGIKFGELGESSETIEELQSLIGYRHKIIHVSALLGMLNQETVPPEEPVFAKNETARKARNCLVSFVEKLHQATLNLRALDIPSQPIVPPDSRCSLTPRR